LLKTITNYSITIRVNLGNDMKKYMCVICGFVYDEAAGLPEHGIPPGTRWEDIPLNWTCPDCGASKEDFEMVEM
jgi:rubredoxin